MARISVPPHCGQSLAIAAGTHPNSKIARKQTVLGRTLTNFVIRILNT
jgi:hypothetical protein